LRFAKLHQLGYDWLRAKEKSLLNNESIKLEISFPLTVFLIRDLCSPCTRSHERAGLPLTGPFSCLESRLLEFFLHHYGK
jgi:hypothetical protein